MSIIYRETAYHCRCDCGQKMFLFMGHCHRKKIPPPHNVATVCPACGKAAWISYDVRKGDLKPLPRHQGRANPVRCAVRNRLLYEDLPILEQSVEHYKQAYQQAYNRLTSLESAVRHAIGFWDHHWQRSLMPTFFRDMERCLQEQTRDF